MILKLSPELGFAAECPVLGSQTEGEIEHCSFRVLSCVTVTIKSFFHVAKSRCSSASDMLTLTCYGTALQFPVDFLILKISSNREPSVYDVCESNQIKIGDK